MKYYGFWLLLSCVCVFFIPNSYAAPQESSITIPHYEIIETLRTELYNLRFLESRSLLQTQINATPPVVRATYQAVFKYVELTTLLGEHNKPLIDAFDKQIELATALLEKQREKEPNNPVWAMFQGLIYGLNAGVAMAYHKSYFTAYRNGLKGVRIFEDLQKSYPTLYDTYLSSGVLKIMIAQSTWIVQTFAPLIVTTGSLEEGAAELEIAAQKGAFVAQEAQIFNVFLMFGEVPGNIRLKGLRELGKLVGMYPDNIQLYYFIARGYEKIGNHVRANYYALSGLKRLESANTQFIDKYRIPLRAFLLRIHYRYLLSARQWNLLKSVSETAPDSSGVSQAYHAFALLQLKQTSEGKRLAAKTLKELDPSRLTVPFFIAPLSLKLDRAVREFLEEQVLSVVE